MHVLLLGGTGNLGSRCIPALLAHKHTVTLYLRNPSKLQLLVSPSVIEKTTIVIGDATDSKGIMKAILDHDIEGIVNTAGTQVSSGQEFLLSKIAKAVMTAATSVGKERGRPLRTWLVCGMGVLQYPGTPNSYLLQDYMPRSITDQHEATRAVVEAIPLSDLGWSLICVAMMKPANSNQGVFELLDAPIHHNLLLKATIPPAWEDCWVRWIPFIGVFLNLWVVVLGQYKTKYENVADFLAEDLGSDNKEWVGMKVGLKDKGKIKTT